MASKITPKDSGDYLDFNGKEKNRDKNIESLLILEKAFEGTGQKWVDNLNVIEQFLVKIVEIIGKNHTDLAANFIVRRLPIYTASLSNKNEYAVVLRNIDFTLLPPRRSSTVDSLDKPPIGQVEIFRRPKRKNIQGHIGNSVEGAAENRGGLGAEDIVNEDGAFRSHEIFKKFASAFVRASTLDTEEENSEANETEKMKGSSPANFLDHLKKEKVQLLGPHLLQDMIGSKEIGKIFTLTSLAFADAEYHVSKQRRPRYADCKISINYLKSVITVSLDDTEVSVRPCVFYSKGYNRVNSVILDRIPLFHPSIIAICEGLSKGCLLFPTSFESLWNLQMWPCESHMISTYHSSSVVTRIFKLYTAFCLNPSHFWETLNNCFLIGMDDLQDGSDDSARMRKIQKDHFSVEFCLSTFLYELENFAQIQDWAPSSFYKRLLSLVAASVDSFDKGFHAQYFTGLNILHGLWKHSMDYFGREEKYALQELDGIDEEEDDAATTVTAERSTDYLDIHDDEDDDFGLHFDNLDIDDDGLDVFPQHSQSQRGRPLTSDLVYKSVNPFASTDDIPGNSKRVGGKKSGRKYELEYEEDRAGNGKKKAKTLSKMFGSNLMKKFTALGRSQSDVHAYSQNPNGGGSGSNLRKVGKQKSLADITSDFVENLSQSRREQCQMDSISSGSQIETCFTTPRYNERGVDTEFPAGHRPPRSEESSVGKYRGRSLSVPVAPREQDKHKKRKANLAQEEDLGSLTSNSIAWRKKTETIYSNILAILSDIPPSDYLCDSEVTQELGKSLKNLKTQEELVKEWLNTMSDFPNPKTICPHSFNPRQIQYIAKVIQSTSKCLPSAMIMSASVEATNSRVTAWEISGDLLRVVLHQLRSEPAVHEALRLKQDKLAVKKLSLKSLKNMLMSTSNDQERTAAQGERSSCQPFSFKRRHSVICTGHLTPGQQGPNINGDEDILDPVEEIQFAMEEPEVAATNRLLQWLWQLRTSGIGRLSFKAKRYLEQLHTVSHINSFFLEQDAEEKILRSMALKSAVAVSRIMNDPNVPAYVPLVAATKKGWQWAEMILSLASWNKEKGFPIQADVINFNNEAQHLLRDISLSGGVIGNTLKKSKSQEPDFEALTLAFHSELATPLGWNDFEDPRKPGPFTVPVLILSSMSYFKQWEMIPGNVVQVMIRLQRFSNLEHVAALLLNPHRKTAMNEVRKLNKTLSFRVYQFDDSVMSKTFKRLASLRSTRKKLHTIYMEAQNSRRGLEDKQKLYSCHQLGCLEKYGIDNHTFVHQSPEVECTRL